MTNDELERGVRAAVGDDVAGEVIKRARELPANLSDDARIALIADLAKSVMAARNARLERQVADVKAETSALRAMNALFPTGGHSGSIH
jgi:hypothetical protein